MSTVRLKYKGLRYIRYKWNVTTSFGVAVADFLKTDLIITRDNFLDQIINEFID